MLFWIGIVVGALVLLAIAIFAFGTFALRRSVAQAETRLADVTSDQIPALAADCEEVFERGFQIRLAEAEAATIGSTFERFLTNPDIEPLKVTFAEEDFYWRFVLSLGAFLGEFVRKHRSAAWVPSELGGQLALQNGDGDGSLTIHPFGKVIKHAFGGQREQMQLYLEIATGQQPVPQPTAG